MSTRLNEVWQEKYATRAPEYMYRAEELKQLRGSFTLFQYLQGNDIEELISKFLGSPFNDLENPGGLSYSLLRNYLLEADLTSLTTNPSPKGPQPALIILDDRRDPTNAIDMRRAWDSDGPGPQGYLRYPPTGQLRDLPDGKEPPHVESYALPDLLERLNKSRIELKAEKRTIYIANLTSESIITIIASAAARSIPLLKNFFHQNLLFRPSFQFSLGITFSLQFHIPYLALRGGPAKEDARKIGQNRVRARYILPLPRPDEQVAYYYESVNSFLVTGIDEWFWTSYCIVDTYFGSEEYRVEYLKEPTSLRDAASGGSLSLKFPMWHPLEYFLLILSRRIVQASSELSILGNLLVERLNHYEATFVIFDDEKLTKTNELNEAISCLRKIRDTIYNVTEAWNDFYTRSSDLFEAPGNNALRSKWQGLLGTTQDSVSSMKSLYRVMAQKQELFSSMREGLVNASALKESTNATRQGKNVGLLTRMTVLYLPLSLTTGVFSMSMVPSPYWLWIVFGVFLLIVLTVTLYITRHPQILNWLFRIKD